MRLIFAFVLAALVSGCVPLPLSFGYCHDKAKDRNSDGSWKWYCTDHD